MKFKNNEVAIVTGGSRGIGRGIAKVLSQEGARIVLADINAKDGLDGVDEIKQAGGEALFVRCDVAKEADCDNLLKETIDAFGQLDVLVNNAGIGGYNKLHETSEASWDKCMNVDLKGVFLVSKAAIPHMLEKEKGAIVNISSVHALKSVNACAAYDAAKGAVSALTRQMCIDYGPYIRVNDISPGWVESDLVQSVFDSYDDPVAKRKEVEDRQVMKRIGRADDIGKAVAFLASDEASFITGAQLVVDGGLTSVLEMW